MSLPLTQRDIDALVARTGDEASGPLAQPFEFGRTSRLSRDRRVVLESVHERFAQQIQAKLGAKLRAQIDVGVRSIERIPFGALLVSLGSPCAAFVFEPGGRIAGPALLDIGLDVGFHLVDRLFGGSGEAARQERALTGLERTVLADLASGMLEGLALAWQEQTPLAPRIVAFESDPDMLQITARGDDALVVVMEMQAGAFRGLLTLAMPMAALEPVFAARPAATRTANTAAGADRPRVEAGIGRAGLSVSACLPHVRLPARTLAALTPGQVLQLGLPKDTPVDVQINGRTRYRASLGQQRKRIALRITAVAAASGRPARQE